MKNRIKELLNEYHAAEIGRIVDLTDAEVKKIVREIYLVDWGYTEWEPVNTGEGFVLFCHGAEWIDENGDYLVFDTKAEALQYLGEVTA